MKTKNIFRMLLVAAALLMGANNVKADEQLWPATAGEGSQQLNYYPGISISSDAFTNLETGDVLKFKVTPSDNNGAQIQIKNSDQSVTIYSGNVYEATEISVDVEANTVTALQNGMLIFGSNNLYLNSVIRIPSPPLATGENVIWGESSFWLNNWDQQQAFSCSTLKFRKASVNDKVRLYINIPNDQWQISFKLDTTDWPTLNVWGTSKAGVAKNGVVDVIDTSDGKKYIEFPLTDVLTSITAVNNFILQGQSIEVKKVVIYVAESGDPTKPTPSLTFPQSTYNITYGDSFTGPIATCDVSDLEVRYETSNRSVADVVYLTGEVEIKGAGQAVITARTEASSNYNVATASYTINVAKVNYTLSYSASTATAVLGQSWTAPTLNNPSNISVTYSSTNTGVATINQNGTVTLVGAGQTTIKANYAGDNNHEAKEASYVLTVSTPQPTISFSQASYTTTFGEAFTAPVPTVYPAGSSVVYTSSNKNVAIVHNNTVIPVGTGAKDASYGETTITATLADNSNISATYTLRVNAPTAPQGATSVGAIWLGQYGDQGNGGLQPQLSISQYFSARESGGQIRFYGKVGPLNDNSYWRVEIVDPSWSSPRLYEAQGNGLTNGYFAVDVNNVNLSGIDYIILNGTNITITAVQVVAPATQTYTATAASTSNGTVSLNPTSGLAEGDVVTITATPATDYEVGSVSVTYGTNGSITPSSIGNNQYTFSMPAANVTVTVTFNEIETANGEFDAVNMGDYAYRTYVTPCAINFSRSVGVEAYCATSYDEQSVTFTQVTGTCNAGVPVLLKKKTGAEEFKLWKLTDEDATGNTPSTNYLVAGPATVHSANKYVLTVHSGVVVFAETNFQSATVDASHAYLYLHNTNAARGRLTIRLNGESTGISSLQSDEPSLDGAVYNLRGQRVEHPTKGLYIINGKKVVIK